MLINEIILEQAKPLKDGDKVSLHNVEFIYDQPTNSFKRKADGVTVNTGSEAHALLMGIKGFQPDGKSPLQPGTWDSIKKAVSTAMGGPLGQASRMDPKASILGKILGTAGDAVSRLLKKGMVSYQKNKQSKIDQIDQTNKDRMQGYTNQDILDYFNKEMPQSNFKSVDEIPDNIIKKALPDIIRNKIPVMAGK